MGQLTVSLQSWITCIWTIIFLTLLAAVVILEKFIMLQMVYHLDFSDCMEINRWPVREELVRIFLCVLPALLFAFSDFRGFPAGGAELKWIVGPRLDYCRV